MFEVFATLILSGMLLKAQADLVPQPLQASTLPQAHERPVSVVPRRRLDVPPSQVVVSASDYIIVDQASNTVLDAHNADTPRSVASITKLMTALVFLEHNPGWDTPVTMMSDDMRSGAIRELFVGDTVTVRDLFNVMLVSSTNEAAVALARSTGMDEVSFVAAMNAKARALGMAQAHFVEVTGLSADNSASARDIAILTQTAFAQTQLYQAARQSEYQFTVSGKLRRVTSTNWALGDPFGLEGQTHRIEAGKTGYIESAGYCFTSQIRDEAGYRLTVVVLGSEAIESRFTDAKVLATWAFNHYQWSL